MWYSTRSFQDPAAALRHRPISTPFPPTTPRPLPPACAPITATRSEPGCRGRPCSGMRQAAASGSANTASASDSPGGTTCRLRAGSAVYWARQPSRPMMPRTDLRRERVSRRGVRRIGPGPWARTQQGSKEELEGVEMELALGPQARWWCSAARPTKDSSQGHAGKRIPHTATGDTRYPPSKPHDKCTLPVPSPPRDTTHGRRTHLPGAWFR